MDDKTRGLLSTKNEEAKEIMNNQEKQEDLMKKVEDKIRKFPGIGDKLADLVTMIDLVRMYFLKEYREVPTGTIIAVVAALVYWVSPVDIIPDSIPGLGIIDDVAVLGYCANMVQDDLKAFRKWRDHS